MADERPSDSFNQRPEAVPPSISVTVNGSGLVTQDALDLIGRRIEEAIAQALDDARRMQTDVGG